MISAWWLLVAVVLTAILSTVFILAVIAVAYANKDIDNQWGREFEMEKAEERARRLRR